MLKDRRPTVSQIVVARGGILIGETRSPWWCRSSTKTALAALGVVVGKLVDDGEGPHLQREEGDVAARERGRRTASAERPGGAGGDRHRGRDPQALAQQGHGERGGERRRRRRPAPPARSAGDGRERLLIRRGEYRSAAERPGAAAPPRLNRMAALCRRTLLAPTRSTPCFGSASSPPRSSSSRSTSALLYVRPPLPRRARRRAAPADRRPRASRSGSAACSPLFAAAALRRSASSSPTRPARRPTTGAAGLASAKREPLTIKATGQQWLWRYDYPNGAFSYYKLVVPVDTAVELELRLDRRRPHLERRRPRRQARRRPRQDQPRRLPRRRGRRLRRAVGDPLRPGLRGDADRGRSRLAGGIRRVHQDARKPTSRPPRNGSST